MSAKTNDKPARKSVAKASSIVAGATFCSRILGLVRDQIIAGYFGAGRETDAFFVAFKIPNLLRRLVAEGSLATAFVPVFVDEKENSDEDARQALGAVASFTLLITVTLTLFGIIFADQIALAFAPGFAAQADKLALAAELTALMFPYVVLVSVLALVASVLNSLGYFALPALAPAILNVVLIVSVISGHQLLEQPIFSLAYAVLFGGVIALVPQLILLKRVGFPFHLRSPFHQAAVKKLTKLMLPSVFSASLYQLMIFINTLLASVLVERSVSWLYYADRIVQFPLGVFTIAVATAVLPSLSTFAARKDFAAFNKQINAALSWMTIITVAAAVGLATLAQPIIEVIYQHGAFSSNDAINTSSALIAYSVGLWAVSCQSILVRAFLAIKDTVTPAIITAVAIVMNITFAFALMGPPDSATDNGFFLLIAQLQSLLAVSELDHVGLALAGSFSSLLSFFLLLCSAQKRKIELNLTRMLKDLIHSCLAAAAMFLVIALLKLQILNSVYLLLVAIPLGALVYLFVLLLLGSSSAKQILDYARAKIS